MLINLFPVSTYKLNPMKQLINFGSRIRKLREQRG